MTSIAPPYPDRSAPAAPRDAAPVGAGRRPSRGFVGLFVLSCFAPYPALAIGTSNGLQLSQALALASVPALVAGRPGRTFLAFVALLTPIVTAAFVATLRPATPEPAVLLKEAVALGLALVPLWPACWLADRRRFRDALVLAAVAVLAHSLLGAYQVYSFGHDEFPLLWLYRNPSFKDMAEWAPVYALYIKRPCGLFPEPSAMAASLGPWLVLLCGWLAGSAPGMPAGRRARRLTAAAVAGGFLLLAASRSGSALAVMAGVLVALTGRERAPGRGRWLALGAVVAATAGVVGFLLVQLGSSLEQRVESSWGMRSQSIVVALTANTTPLEMVFGVGPGQSTPIVRVLMNGVPRPKDQDDMAVWSLPATYYMEHGMVGAVVLLTILGAAVRAILRSSAAPLGLGALGSWLVGVGVTTSYMALPPVWLFLGMALSWDRVFPRGVRAGGATA